MIFTPSSIPEALSEKLVEEYTEIKKRFSLNDWGPGQLKGGRFAEAVLRVLQHLLGVPITPFGTDIPNTEKTSILNAVQNHPSIDDHIRQKIVPMIRLLLDFRNNRDAAHLGGFDANSVDTLYVMTSATWILAELVRVYGGHTMDEAEKIVNALATKEYPVVIEVDGVTFITRPGLTTKEEILILLYRRSKADRKYLFTTTGYSHRTKFDKIIDDMITAKLVGEKSGECFLLPVGVTQVERGGLLSFTP